MGYIQSQIGPTVRYLEDKLEESSGCVQNRLCRNRHLCKLHLSHSDTLYSGRADEQGSAKLRGSLQAGFVFPNFTWRVRDLLLQQQPAGAFYASGAAADYMATISDCEALAKRQRRKAQTNKNLPGLSRVAGSPSHGCTQVLLWPKIADDCRDPEIFLSTDHTGGVLLQEASSLAGYVRNQEVQHGACWRSIGLQEPIG